MLCASAPTAYHSRALTSAESVLMGWSMVDTPWANCLVLKLEALLFCYMCGAIKTLSCKHG